MEKEKLIIIGAGGHARSCTDILLQNGEYDIAGCVDRSYSISDPAFMNIGDCRIPVIGNDDMLEELFFEKGFRRVFVALGNNKIRKKLYDIVTGIGFSPVNIVSKRAVISPSARLGSGICVMAGAVINVNTVIGNDCIINTNCSLDHDCIVGDHCHIAPGTAVSGTVHIGDTVQLGTGTSVIDGLTIGSGSFIGAGSAVVKNIPENVLAYGVPARIIRNI